MEKLETRPKLQQLENFLLKPESEESKNYISALLEGKFGRPEEAFVNEFLNKDFWKELGFSGDEAIIERRAGIKGRVEFSLDFDGKKIGVECKKPYEVKNQKEVINELKGDDINELKDQLGKYLTTHDFVIYTNGFHWFFYSTESHRAWLSNKDKKDNKLKPFFKYLSANDIFNKNSTDYVLNILDRRKILESLDAMEHKSIRHVLSDGFFSDLKIWVKYIDTALSHIPGTKKARTISLINKLIFLRTMEAFSVIPIDFLSRNWEVKKGIGTSILNFVDQIDDDFSEIYDTELFTSKFLEDENGKIIEENGRPKPNPDRNKNYVYKDLPDEFFSALLKRKDETNLQDTGHTKLILKGETFYIRSLYWWKFEKISADILGKAYETYLARERKKLGIYYTPTQMTEFLASNAVNTVFDEKIEKIKSELNKENWNREKINSLGNEFSEIRVCDPSCGSGSFLIQAMRAVWSKYQELIEIIQEKDAQHAKAKPTLDDYSTDKVAVLRYFQGLLKIDDKQQRMGNVILRHIFGNDKDEKAVDTAKLNIWLECLRLDPNSYRRESLRGKRHVLPNLVLNLTVGDSLVDLDVNDLEDVLNDDERKGTLESIFKLKELYVDSFDKTSIAYNAATLRDTFIDVFLNPVFSEKMGKEFTKNLFTILMPAFWPVRHLSAFFNKNGELKKKDEQGFDIIIGNPPWEILEPSVDEFYGPLYNSNDMAKFSLLKKREKNAIQEELLKDTNIVHLWEKYNKDLDLQREYFSKSKSYLYQTAKTKTIPNKIKPNLYKIFLEKYFFLAKKGGIVGVVLPANIYTDLGTKGLRQLLFDESEIISLYSFENRKAIFEEIHRQYKFVTLLFKKGGKTSKFKSAFYIRDIERLPYLDAEAMEYDIDLVRRASPDSLTILECKNQQDVNIINKALQFPLLSEPSDWKIRFQREFNSTDDHDLMNTAGRGAPVYEGKMMHQFTHQYSTPRYWIDTEKGIEILKNMQIKRMKKQLKKEKKDDPKILSNVKIDFDFYRLIWRHITNATNQRTLIATVVPPKVFLIETVPYLRPNFFDGEKFIQAVDNKTILFLCGLFNSFVVDFIIRQRVSTHATASHVIELPIPRLNENDKYFQEIVERAAKLICTTPEFDNLKKKINISNGVTDLKEREILIAQINAYATKIYNLTREELEYILNSFPIVDNSIKQQTLSEFDKLG